MIDMIASLSVERCHVDSMNVYSTNKYDVNRPHRGMITSASVIRVITQGSKVATRQSILKNDNEHEKKDGEEEKAPTEEKAEADGEQAAVVTEEELRRRE